jgi:hypothetical protein
MNQSSVPARQYMLPPWLFIIGAVAEVFLVMAAVL